MELHSQQVRALAPESDPLKIGMGWTIDDLSKPQIMVESTFGDSHPGSAHLDQFVRQAVQAVNEHGGKAARYFATDLCDGIAQGHDGINYSLAHREAIVDLVEAQANASGFDGGIFIASCDKAVPAMLMSIGRLKEMSAIVVTGGVMEAHPLPEEYTVQDPACAINELLTLEQIGKFDAWEKTGVISGAQLDYYKRNACPSCGACSFMGTASTMQIMAEALGLMLPGASLMPATAPELQRSAYDAGVQLMILVKRGICAKDIVTKESFENAIMIHAAISGSTNAIMHLPAIAHEFGIEIDANTFDRMHRGAHYLLNIRPSGDWPAQYFYYAGGVPRVMEELRSVLHLDVMTVTGKTLGENLEALKQRGFYERCDALLREKSQVLGLALKRTDIIRSFNNAKGTDGSVAILKGNLAPEGCVIKHTACPKEMLQATLRARAYNSEEECIAAVSSRQRDARDVLHRRGHLCRLDACLQRGAHYGRALLRCKPWSRHWACQSRGSSRWAHRAGGGRRPDSNRHTKPHTCNCWRKRAEKNARGDRFDPCRAPRILAAEGAQTQKGAAQALRRTRRQPYERRIYGISV